MPCICYFNGNVAVGRRRKTHHSTEIGGTRYNGKWLHLRARWLLGTNGWAARKGQAAVPSNSKTARVLFKYGAQSEGYWNCEKFLIQLENAVQIAEVKYPSETHSLAFIFDQSSGHTAYADDALNAHRMNVADGGKQPKRRDTSWNGRPQLMINELGEPKGLRTVLEEHNRHGESRHGEGIGRNARFQDSEN